MKETVIITEESAESASGGRGGQGERLDKFLANNLPEKSRSQWQKTIKAGLVFVNNKKPTPHYWLKKNDNLFISEDAPIPKISRGFELAVVFEDDNFLVIDKPAGLTVHPPNENYPEETLVDLLLKKYPGLKEIGDPPAGGQETQLRPGIVHRLDKDVSGLLIVAKSQPAFNQLKSQFQNRTIKKEYLALVHGQLVQPAGLIDFPVAKSSDDSGKMAARPKSQGGHEAITEYEVLETIKSYSLLNVKIKTGRTHQIRVHLNAIGHPIVGDAIYHPAKMKVKVINRLFLHASYLAFADLDGEIKAFNSDLPPELTKIIAEIKA
ncbi:MAG: RluA family pseudouridine synthase [bacterium]